MKLIFISILLLLSGMNLTFAQDAILSTGSEITGTSGSVSYSIGQVFYCANIIPAGTITQGVQQPFEITTVTLITQDATKPFTITVLPNPTTDILILKINNTDLSRLYFQLYDINGQLIKNEAIRVDETIIDMSNQIPSTYILKIIQDNTDVISYKILKK